MHRAGTDFESVRDCAKRLKLRWPGRPLQASGTCVARDSHFYTSRIPFNDPIMFQRIIGSTADGHRAVPIQECRTARHWSCTGQLHCSKTPGFLSSASNVLLPKGHGFYDFHSLLLLSTMSRIFCFRLSIYSYFSTSSDFVRVGRTFSLPKRKRSLA